jgi:predicted metalloprotease
VLGVTQQRWGTQPGQPGYGQAPYGPQPQYAPSGFGRPGFGAPGFQHPNFGRPPLGAGFGPQAGLPRYAPAPPTPQPPRPRSPLRLVLLALAAVTVLAMGGLILAVALSGTSDVAYQNDDYKVPPPDTNPPPIPQAKTVGEAREVLTKNPIYAQTTPIPVRCNSQPINVGTADDDQLKGHFEGLMECLVRVWQPPVTGAGFQIVRPTVTIYGSSMTTKCGTSEVNAFYCSADQQIYYSNQLHRFVDIVAEEKWAADVVMAHEFGHALQGRTGILFSSHALGQMSGDEQINLEFSRRLETQADCFSGMFIRSVSQSLGVQQSDLQGIEETYVAVGDDTLSGKPDVIGNHGRGESRRYWGLTGLGTSDVGQCNTFIARSDQVR